MILYFQILNQLKIMCFMLSCFEGKKLTHTHTHNNLANHSHHSTFYNSGINHCHGPRPVSDWSRDFILQPENTG